jgi:hypothetical protein
VLGRLFKSARGIASPRDSTVVCFDESIRVLSVGMDFTAGTCFAAEDAIGDPPVQDDVTRTYRHDT